MNKNNHKRNPIFVTSPYRAIMACLKVCLLTSMATGLLFMYPLITSPKVDFGWNMVKEFFEVGIISFFVWLIGVTVFGGPMWFIFDKLNWRNYYHFGFLGGAVPFVVMFCLFYFFIPNHGFNNRTHYELFIRNITASLVFAAVGVIIGLLIRMFAYRKLEN